MHPEEAALRCCVHVPRQFQCSVEPSGQAYPQTDIERWINERVPASPAAVTHDNEIPF